MNGKGISLSYLQEEIQKACKGGVNDDRLDAIDDYSSLDKLQDCLVLETLDIVHNLFHSLNGDGSFENCMGPLWPKGTDLRSTHIEQLEVNDPDVQEIYLPQGIQNVTLKAFVTLFADIFPHGDGYSLALEVELQDDHLPDVGLPKLMKLVLNNIKDFDLSTIITTTSKSYLVRTEWTSGNCVCVSCIKQLKGLETLLIFDLFGFSYDDFPLPADLSNLQWLWLQSVPADAGKAIKRLYKTKFRIWLFPSCVQMNGYGEET